MITGSEVKRQLESQFAENVDLETALYRVVKENLRHVPDYLQDDPEELSTILSAVQYFAREVHPEFGSSAETHDIVLLRLLPKKKTERYIQSLIDEAQL